MLSPASAKSRSFLNISIPVTTVVLFSSVRPTISTSSDILSVPLSTLPVATVPRPVIVNTSSTGIRKGRSLLRSGVGIYSSTASISSRMHLYSSALGSVEVEVRARYAEPLMIGVSSPGKSYSLRSSRISISTSSRSSGSSTWSVLFMNTTI